jgi:MoaA/NifB/PqqE/SkfB family radical SAM enzyme
VFYVNIGGGEPMVRRDFFELVEYSTGHGIGVKFSTNGTYIDADKARRLAAMDYLDIQMSASTAPTPPPTTPSAAGQLRHGPDGDGQPGRRRLRAVQDQRRRHPPERRPARRVQGARRRATAPSCASPACALRPRVPTPGTSCTPPTQQQREIYDWLMANGENVLTGDSFFHLNALGSEPLPGLNMCGAGRVVCLIDPIGDVYACPFVIHDEFLAGNVRDPGGFTGVWKQQRPVHVELREPQSGRCLRQLRQRSTPARAAAWRPSSSPASRSTAPTRVRARPRRDPAGTEAGLGPAGRRLGTASPQPGSQPAWRHRAGQHRHPGVGLAGRSPCSTLGPHYPIFADDWRSPPGP